MFQFDVYAPILALPAGAYLQSRRWMIRTAAASAGKDAIAGSNATSVADRAGTLTSWQRRFRGCTIV